MAVAAFLIVLMLRIVSGDAVDDPVRLPCKSPNNFDASQCLFAGDYCDFNTDFRNFDAESIRYHDYVINPDPSRAAFVIESGSPVYENGALKAPLVPPVGWDTATEPLEGKDAMGIATIISTSRFLQYGTFEARLRTSGRPGVVTTFIGFSNDQDEIDVEGTGIDDTNVQANWYYRGKADIDPSNGASVNGVTGHTKDSNSKNFYTYTIHWTNETIAWMLDGELMHEASRNSSGAKGFPEQPMRISFGLWQTYPGSTWAGLSDINDWSKPIAANFQSLRVKCIAKSDQDRSENKDKATPSRLPKPVQDGPSIEKKASTKAVAGDMRTDKGEPAAVDIVEDEESKSSIMNTMELFVVASIFTILLLGLSG